MIGLLTSLFSGGLIGSLERTASEFIETNTEKAEAQTILIKALDPNGKMRRDLSRFACWAYGFYLVMTTVLIFLSTWGVGGELCNAVDDAVVCLSRADVAAGRMTELFVPITASWAGIVSASFGVNGVNSYKGK